MTPDKKKLPPPHELEYRVEVVVCNGTHIQRQSFLLPKCTEEEFVEQVEEMKKIRYSWRLNDTAYIEIFTTTQIPQLIDNDTRR